MEVNGNAFSGLTKTGVIKTQDLSTDRQVGRPEIHPRHQQIRKIRDSDEQEVSKKPAWANGRMSNG